MGNIGARLARLERKTTGPRMYVISGPDEVVGRADCDADAFLRGQGHESEARDLVVIVRKFFCPPTEPVTLVSARSGNDQ
jgi:hypothetical protein